LNRRALYARVCLGRQNVSVAQESVIAFAAQMFVKTDALSTLPAASRKIRLRIATSAKMAQGGVAFARQKISV
jgi:hypothetical protein